MILTAWAIALVALLLWARKADSDADSDAQDRVDDAVTWCQYRYPHDFESQQRCLVVTL